MSNEMKKFLVISLVLLSILTACNKDWSFPDYKYTTVYFPYQTPERTIVLGKDIIDNTLDNQHNFQVMATMGGVYENKKDITLKVAIDPTLANKLKFETATGDSVYVLPSNYFTLPSDPKIVIPAGQIMGGLEVQLTDAFFQDPRSLKNTFVLPVKITSVINADSILSGKSDKTSPDPRNAADWVITPKNFVLYGVKYINPYHGVYLRRGIEVVNGANGNTALDTTVVYHAAYVEKDQVVNVVTTALDQNSLTLNGKNKGNINAPFQLWLKFDNQGKCTISTPATAIGYTVAGNGEFVKDGDFWGNEKRDVLHLKYQVNFGTTIHSFTDTVVVRDRGVKMETFNPVVVN
jgi:hypothetical protein